MDPLDKFKHIVDKFIGRNNVKTIVEAGARDCEETLKFHAEYPQAVIHTFECNPATLPICRNRVKDHDQIHLHECAVADTIGKITFYPIDQERTQTPWKDGNPGASSLFKASGKYLQETYFQNEITVDSITLEKLVKDYNIESIDILWMDIQGAELLALKGLKEDICKIKTIQLEVEFMEIYHHQPLFWEVKKFLNSKGFFLAHFTSFFLFHYADAVFINQDILKKKPLRLILLKIRNKTLYTLYHYFHKIQVILKPSSIKNIIKKSLGIDKDFYLRQFIYSGLRRIVSKEYRNSRGWLFYWNKVCKPALNYDINLKENIKSELPVDVFIPIAEKDLPVLPLVIRSIREHVKHPVKGIYIAADPSAGIPGYCSDNGLIFVNENQLLGYPKDAVGYSFNGEDCSGWIYQQLLKMNSDKVCGCEHILVADGDTLFVRPRKFEHKGKIILDFSDEFHVPYYENYKKLTGFPHQSKVSFICHSMVFERRKLMALRAHIEQFTGKKWDEAIISLKGGAEKNFFSEFELYANFALHKYGHHYIMEYWFNESLQRGGAPLEYEKLVRNAMNRSVPVRSVSLHAWNA